MNLLLISKTPVIKQIFNLVSKKLDIDLTILEVNIVSKEFDIIVIEDTILDDQFPIQNFTKKFGIISKEIKTYENKSDFILQKPFLPSILMDTITKIQNDINNTIKIDNHDEIKSSEEFISSLVEDISSEIIEESDESVVSSGLISDGGILDSSELSKIQNILNDDDSQKNETIDDTTSSDDEWVTLSNIIDEAIDEAKEYQFNIKEPIKLILNDYSMNEVSTLLNKLDQNIIDALVNGEEITLKLKVEK
jgi:hypothetical protein